MTILVSTERETNTGAALNDSEHMNDTAADEDKLDEDAANEDTKKIQMQKMMTQQKMIHQKLQQTVHQVMAVRRLMVHSQVRINVQMLRTQNETSYTTGDFKTSLCVGFFLTALTAIIVYIKRRRNIFVGSKTCKRVKKAVTAGQQ